MREALLLSTTRTLMFLGAKGMRLLRLLAAVGPLVSHRCCLEGLLIAAACCFGRGLGSLRPQVTSGPPKAAHGAAHSGCCTLALLAAGLRAACVALNRTVLVPDTHVCAAAVDAACVLGTGSATRQLACNQICLNFRPAPACACALVSGPITKISGAARQDHSPATLHSCCGAGLLPSCYL